MFVSFVAMLPIKRQLAAARSELRKVRRSEAAGAAKVSRQWVLDDGLFNAVVLMCFQSGGAVGPAVKYIQGVARQRDWPTRGPEEVAAFVDTCILNADEARLLAVTDPSSPSGAAAAQVAARYVQEWALYEWACAVNQNPHGGAAPRCRLVLAQAAAHRSRCAEGGIPPPRGLVTSGAARMWAARWRQRWGGAHARLPVRDQPSLDVMLLKVVLF